MSGDLSIKNRQRAARVDLRQLRRVVRSLLREDFGDEQFALGIHLVSAAEMARLNESSLGHAGPTDVIAFDYGFGVPAPVVRPKTSGPRRHGLSGRLPPELRIHPGEIYICLAQAKVHARRFRTTWQRELARYIIHGLLHLRGFDDRRPADRRRMKREEDRLLGRMARRFPLRKLAGPPRLAA